MSPVVEAVDELLAYQLAMDTPDDYLAITLLFSTPSSSPFSLRVARFNVSAGGPPCVHPPRPLDNIIHQAGQEERERANERDWDSEEKERGGRSLRNRLLARIQYIYSYFPSSFLLSTCRLSVYLRDKSRATSEKRTPSSSRHRFSLYLCFSMGCISREKRV